MKPKPLAVVGDFDADNPSHLATDDAIGHCAAALGFPIEHRWVGTEELALPGGTARLAEFGGLWISPGSPYRSMAGALVAIRTAREGGIPLLGTCGGFQHIVLEYARNVLGIADAQHEESDPYSSILFISRLACSLVGRSMTITLEPGSLVARAYGDTSVVEQYRCNFGVNPDYVELLRSGDLRVVGSDQEGEVRVVELAQHPFFVGTLYVPQHSSTPAKPHPLIAAFLRSCLSAGTR